MPADPPAGADEPPQHMVALERANEVRLGIAKAKRKIEAGKMTVLEVLSDPAHPILGPMRVTDLLTAQRRWGATRAGRFLSDVANRHRLVRGGTAIGATKLHDLTRRERQALETEIRKKDNSNPRK